MKKPKAKKRRGRWLVYTDKKRVFECFTIEAARLCVRALSLAK